MSLILPDNLSSAQRPRGPRGPLTGAAPVGTPGRLVAATLVGLFVVGPLLPIEAQARRRRATSSKKVKATTLELMSMTRGAKIYIDDKLIGEVPLEEPIALSPGTHTVRLQKRGFNSYIDTIKIADGEQRELEADLVPSGGVVKIKCNVPRSQVLLDGKPIGRTPFDGDVTPGKHTLQVVAPGKLQDTRVIEVVAGEAIQIAVTLKDVPPPIVEKDDSIFGTWWFWTAVGVTVVGGVTAGLVSTREIEVAAEGRLCKPSCQTITVGATGP